MTSRISHLSVDARLLALGATQVADFRRPDGRGWVTLADPEGNEFCVLPKDPATRAERDAVTAEAESLPLPGMTGKRITVRWD